MQVSQVPLVSPPALPAEWAPWTTPWAWPWLTARDPIDLGAQGRLSLTFLVVDCLPSGSEAWQPLLTSLAAGPRSWFRELRG